MALAGQHGAEGSWIALCVAFLLHLPATQENFTMLSWQRGTSCRPPADKQAGGQQAEQAGCRLNCSQQQQLRGETPTHGGGRHPSGRTLVPDDQRLQPLEACHRHIHVCGM